MTAPETRSSLIARIADIGDQESWREFCQIYEPLIHRQAKHFGIRDSEAADVIQEVLIAVSNKAADFDPSRDRGRFRTWLFEVGRRTTLAKFRERQRPDRAVGGSDFVLQLTNHPCDSDEQENKFSIDLRRQAFKHVARIVSREVSEQTWQAFWRTAVKNQSVKQVARDLKISQGTVYVSRSRVMARMKNHADQITHDSTGGFKS